MTLNSIILYDTILYYILSYCVILYYTLLCYIILLNIYNYIYIIICIIILLSFMILIFTLSANGSVQTADARWASSLLSERVGPPSPLRLDSLVIISKALFQIGSSRLKCGQLCPAHEILARLFRVHELVPLPSVTALESNKTATPDFDTSASANIYIHVYKYCLII